VTETSNEADSATEGAPRPTRVLIAEDEALIRLDLKEMLQEEGFEVVAEVADGASAVRLTRELGPDLVILDVKMPVMDGIQAAEEIAKERLSAILILTAFSQRDLVEKARRAGAMAYLVKPFQKHDLLPAVEIAAGRFREMSGLEATVDDLQGRLEARVRSWRRPRACSRPTRACPKARPSGSSNVRRWSAVRRCVRSLSTSSRASRTATSSRATRGAVLPASLRLPHVARGTLDTAVLATS